VKLISEGRYDISVGPERPHKWWFATVIDPRSGSLFESYESSWDFVLELLKKGQPIKKITMKKPPGEIGYVMQYKKIYIKVELGKNSVIGRSFHD